LALRLSGNLSDVFFALAIALAAFGLINAAAVAGGAWFGPVRLRSLLRLPRKNDFVSDFRLPRSGGGAAPNRLLGGYNDNPFRRFFRTGSPRHRHPLRVAPRRSSSPSLRRGGSVPASA